VLVRRDGVVIGQPAHAWVSGQLARAWGNASFPRPSPREPFCLAAEQHDVGWADADLSPAVGDDGRPLSFMQQPRPAHVAIWRGAASRLLAQSRYAALLVSLHGTSLYERVDATPETAALIRSYLAEQRALQERLIEGLDREEVDRNRRLLLVLDRLSLMLCHGNASTLEDVPAAGGAVTLRLEPADERTPASPAARDPTAPPSSAGPDDAAPPSSADPDDAAPPSSADPDDAAPPSSAGPDDAAPPSSAARDDRAVPPAAATARFVLDPWPFAAPLVIVGCEGRLLDGSYASDDELRAALDAAPWVPLRWEISPG
jgi:hypothetical protein